MSRTRIKICGLRTLEDALCAAEAGADAVGFVFVERSPRCITDAQAAVIVRRLPPFVEPVALFADASVDHIRAVTDATGIRTLQLHGREDREHVEALAEFRLIKAINFGDAAQQHWLSPGGPRVSALLIDAPAAAGLTGGGGEAFDWSSLKSLDRAALPPLILAGGLTPGNVARAIEVVRPFAVDVSSGVESSRGVKDQAKIKAFCAAAAVPCR